MQGISLVMVLFLAFAAPGSAPGEAGQQPDDKPRLQFSGDKVEIPMPSKGGRSLVEVRVGDSGPFDFIIDTGSGVSVIDTRIATDLGLDVVGSMEVGAPGGQKVKTDRVQAPLLRVGDLVISGAKPITLGLAEMTGGIMHGILGMDLFTEVLLTLDPGAGLAVISNGDLTPGGPGVTKLDTAKGGMNFDIDVAGRTLPAHLDTGSPSSFTLPVELIDEIPCLDEPGQEASAGLVGGSRKITLKTLDGIVSFAGLEYENPRIGFMDPSPGSVNVGSRILNDLVITLDLKNSLLAFRQAGPERRAVRSKATPGEASGESRRLGIRFRGAPPAGFSHVASVEPGSLGESAGLRAGDVLISLNGKPMSEYDMASLGALIRGTDPLRWEVERDGTRHVIEIP